MRRITIAMLASWTVAATGWTFVELPATAAMMETWPPIAWGAVVLVTAAASAASLYLPMVAALSVCGPLIVITTTTTTTRPKP